MMDSDSKWLVGCWVLWTVSVCLMVYGSLTSTPAAAWWSLLVGLGACLPSGRIIIDRAIARGRQPVEEIAAIAAREVLRNRDVPSLH